MRPLLQDLPEAIQGLVSFQGFVEETLLKATNVAVEGAI